MRARYFRDDERLGGWSLKKLRTRLAWRRVVLWSLLAIGFAALGWGLGVMSWAV